MESAFDQFNRPLRELRISVTDRCNFRCIYCMPADVFGSAYPFLSRDEILSFEEWVRLAKIFVQFGLKKIRLTGGEPLLRKDLSHLIQKLADLPLINDIALTTNGLLLAKMANELHEAGLERVTVSLDSLDEKVFAGLNGNKAKVEDVLFGIDAALEVGMGVKVNMLVMKGQNEDGVTRMAEYMKERGVNLRFIEYMDVGSTNKWKLSEVFTSKQILKLMAKRFDFVPMAPTYKGEVAGRYQYVDDKNEFGIISSISQPFCTDCSRARISSNGQLYTCLFSSTGHDLKTMLRNGTSDDEIKNFIRKNWNERKDRYSEERLAYMKDGSLPFPAEEKKVEMSFIGG